MCVAVCIFTVRTHTRQCNYVPVGGLVYLPWFSLTMAIKRAQGLLKLERPRLSLSPKGISFLISTLFPFVEAATPEHVTWYIFKVIFYLQLGTNFSDPCFAPSLFWFIEDHAANTSFSPHKARVFHFV